MQILSSLVANLCPTFAAPWSVAYWAPLCMGFPRQDYWSGSPFFHPGIEPVSLVLQEISCIAGEFFMTEPPGKPYEF